MFGKAAPTFLLLFFVLTGCAPTYSPDIYASNAAQQANKVDQAIVVGVRPVMISADATVGAGAGGAAGGIAGSQAGSGAIGAFGALTGSLAGGIAGSVVTHSTADTNGFEYIVRKANGDLLSVTQKDTVALSIGQMVLIIAGPQARIVPDYTVHLDDKPLHPEAKAPAPPEIPAEKKPVEAESENKPLADSARPEVNPKAVE
jgi:outer membrane lipoprotein SlyB